MAAVVPVDHPRGPTAISVRCCIITATSAFEFHRVRDAANDIISVTLVPVFFLLTARRYQQATKHRKAV